MSGEPREVAEDRPRRGPERPRLRRVAFAVLAATVPAIVAFGRAPRGDPPKVAGAAQGGSTRPATGGNPLRSDLEETAEAILARQGVVADAEVRADERSAALDRAVSAHRDAKLRLEGLRASLEVYQQEDYPRSREAAQGEVKLAEVEQQRAGGRLSWSEGMLKKGYTTPAQVERDRLDSRAADLWLERTKQALETLDKTDYPRNCRQLQTDIEGAEAEVSARAAEWERARLVHQEARDRLAEVALTPGEARSIVLMDDALRLEASGDGKAARATLDETKRLWGAEAAHRSAIRSADLRRRLGRAAEQVRAKAPARDAVK